MNKIEQNFINATKSLWNSWDLWLKLLYIGSFGIILSLIGYGMRYINIIGFN